MSGTTKQITERRLKDSIYKVVVSDPNILGEILFEYSFVGKGRGCYNNFELHKNFRPISSIKKDFAPNFLGDWDSLGLTPEDYEEEVEKINAYIDPELDLKVLWLWDGDGRLIFAFDDMIIENNDIKKDYTWKFIK